MFTFICAEYPFALKMNGILTPRRDGAAINTTERDLLETVPLAPVMPRGFFVDEPFMSASEPDVLKVDLRGGAFIKLLTPEEKTPFTAILQQKLNGALVTVYRENGLKLTAETANDAYICPLPRNLSDFHAEDAYLGGNRFIAVSAHASGYEYLLLLATDGGLHPAFESTVDGFSLDGELKTTTVYKDIAKHRAENSWVYSGGKFIPDKCTLSCGEHYSPNNLPIKLLPYAFCEALQSGDDLAPFISQALLNNADKLKSYLGEVVACIPPPTFRNKSEVGLVYKRGENLYECKYLTCEFEGRAICNVRLN